MCGDRQIRPIHDLGLAIAFPQVGHAIATPCPGGPPSRPSQVTLTLGPCPRPAGGWICRRTECRMTVVCLFHQRNPAALPPASPLEPSHGRSEERRVGKEWISRLSCAH